MRESDTGFDPQATRGIDADDRQRRTGRDLLTHGGPPAEERIETLPIETVAISGRLEPHQTVTQALAGLVAAAGCRGAVIEMRGGHGEPFAFVGPAESTDDKHAAWYSETRAPEGGATLLFATAIVGWRDGKPFIHCHGHWQCEDETVLGHLLCDDTVLTEPVEVTGFGSRTAAFESLPDAETRFTLFTPHGEPASESNGFLLRVRPHEDIVLAVETACRRHGITEGTILGIGSLIGIRFDDAPPLAGPPTEVVVERGRIDNGRATLDIAGVDASWDQGAGRLTRGDNPVCVTFELLVAKA
ncbi:MAG: DUF296 domain-containing protein [Fulvimarina manganoxydans]|uniref:DUF296 domain-containing protein n=1 Tax=Fulvimarina manganoxydans TaxID=937218 RepID=UPI002357316D|nr:DUF296 domain-containing protein [Fulvimarina manganoxydans]MCK5930869.1 DUF296 domain-containing protein [Fulvimarina manganoxydans]